MKGLCPPTRNSISLQDEKSKKSVQLQSEHKGRRVLGRCEFWWRKKKTALGQTQSMTEHTNARKRLVPCVSKDDVCDGPWTQRHYTPQSLGRTPSPAETSHDLPQTVLQCLGVLRNLVLQFFFLLSASSYSSTFASDKLIKYSNIISIWFSLGDGERKGEDLTWQMLLFCLMRSRQALKYHGCGLVTATD